MGLKLNVFLVTILYIIKVGWCDGLCLFAVHWKTYTQKKVFHRIKTNVNHTYLGLYCWRTWYMFLMFECSSHLYRMSCVPLFLPCLTSDGISALAVADYSLLEYPIGKHTFCLHYHQNLLTRCSGKKSLTFVNKWKTTRITVSFLVTVLLHCFRDGQYSNEIYLKYVLNNFWVYCILYI